MRKAAAGIWVGLTVIFLLASLAMVQLRCKVTGGYPCGDWPRDGYTWHFWPAFVLLLLVWAATAGAWTRRARQSFWRGVETHGEAVSPMLGLVVAWAWYGLTGPQFHPPACTVPVLCHDVLPRSVAIWSLPWVVWGTWRLVWLWLTPSGVEPET